MMTSSEAEQTELKPPSPAYQGGEVVRTGQTNGQLPAVNEQDKSKGDGEPAELDDFGLPIRKSRPGLKDGTQSSTNLAGGKEGGSCEDLPALGQVEGESGRAKIMRSVSAPVKDLGMVGDEGGLKNDTLDGQKGAETGEKPVNGVVAESSDSPATGPNTTDVQPEPKKDELKSIVPTKHTHHNSQSGPVVSEWSHQHLNTKDEESESEGDGGWQDMTAADGFDVYDDHGRLVAKGTKEEEATAAGYQGLGGAGKGYTRVQVDEDAQSATSLDDDTRYLFTEPQSNALGVEDDIRDPLSQLKATKDLLTEGQRIAYVGVTRLTIFQMVRDIEKVVPTKSSRKYYKNSIDSITKWGQQMMIRLYTHMEIDSAEQIMIEQLAEHGVQPADLVPPLMQNARVKNPMADEEVGSPKTSKCFDSKEGKSSHPASHVSETSKAPSGSSSPPPPYEEHINDELPEVKTPSQLPSSDKLDIDLRWTVLCDLFLVLIADSTYDSRSRRLLERVGETMDISWVQICRFEKRVIDALEMQEEASKETWDEAEHMENRRKLALKRRYMIMGLATVGGGLVIGLSAGLLAPVIGAGLAAGFTTIGVSGTGAFLGGVGGTALITSTATLSGSTIGIRASNRRTGAVKTFEYRPLHNNKRLNLVVTAAGWMTGKVDDVRLPFSTVDPIMGDIYSILWEPEMLRSMGETINILATEALTQGLQQVLGSTVLVALMASLQLPIVLTKLSYLIDNPWNVSLARAGSAGLILADSLLDRNLGNRPITLIGFSLGAKLIFSCLKELANKGAYGLIQNVFLFGSPIVANKDEYFKALSVVSGRFVNGYASNDWILGYLFRATSGGIMRVAGLAPVENVPGIENLDVTHLVNGHMAYRSAMPRLLREVGWEVESDEFAEIEDPDPDNHQERQRELMREINEARKEAEAKPEKKRFGLFKRGKLAEKKKWETYDADSNSNDRDPTSPDGSAGQWDNNAILFDIDAIRAELASEQIEVKQLESTLPPIKLDLNSPPVSSPAPDSAAPSSTQQIKSPTVESSKSEPSIADTAAGTTAAGTATSSTPDGKEKELPALPKPPDQKENIHDKSYHEWPRHDDDIHMTFDTAFSDPSPPPYTLQKNNDDPIHSPPAPETQSYTPSSTNKTPLSEFDNSGLAHNAWADPSHDDRDDNGEGIKLTFA